MALFVDPRFESVYGRYPLTLVDVGARGGLKANWASAAPHLRLIGFEPDAAELARLVDDATAAGAANTYLGVALHERRAAIQLHVARDRGLSSIFPPDRAFLDAFPDAERFDTVAVHEARADALDDVLKAHALGGVDFLKVDTQGSELFVLRGAGHTLASSAIGVEVEVEFTPIYSGQPLFADVDAYLRGLGFQLFDLRPCYWKRSAGRSLGGPRGQIIWADALYLKKVPALRDAIAGLPSEERASKALKAVSISLLYGYYDYALEIARHTADVFTPDDHAALVRALERAGLREAHAPSFPGRRRFASLVHRLWRFTRERNEGWSVSDAEIGNLR
jgi:FkbM family methyltransferase